MGALAILCVLGMCRPQGICCFSFCLGRGAIFSPIVWQGMCFDPGLTLKFWQGFVILPFFSGKGGNFLFWEG